MRRAAARITVEERLAAACLSCGYALRGLATPRCPECGRAFDWDDPWTMRLPRRRRHAAMRLALRLLRWVGREPGGVTRALPWIALAMVLYGTRVPGWASITLQAGVIIALACATGWTAMSAARRALRRGRPASAWEETPDAKAQATTAAATRGPREGVVRTARRSPERHCDAMGGGRDPDAHAHADADADADADDASREGADDDNGPFRAARRRTAILLGVIVIVVLLRPAMFVGFWVSRPALQRMADEVMAQPFVTAGKYDCGRCGVFYADSAQRCPHGVRIAIETWDSSPTSMQRLALRGGGFVYKPEPGECAKFDVGLPLGAGWYVSND